MKVCELIRKIAYTEPHYGVGSLPVHYSDSIDSYNESGLFTNAYSVGRLMSSLFADAHRKGEPFSLRVCCPFDFHILFDLISRYHALGARFTVDHIVRLEQRTMDGALRNLELITALIPFNYTAKEYYRSYYYYSSCADADDVYEPYPYWLIIDGKLVLLSRYFADAVLIVEPEVVRGYNDSFSYSLDTGNEHNICRPLIDYTNSTDGIYDYFAMHVTAGTHNDAFSQVIMSTPPLCPVFAPEDIALHARTEIPGLAELADKLVGLRHDLSTSGADKRCVYIFSLEGLDRFLETGETIEYPPDLMNPFTVKERLQLLDTYTNIIREGGQYYIADTSKLLIPANIMVRTLVDGKVDFLLYDSSESPFGMTSITLSEKSIYSAFDKFSEFVVGSNLVLSNRDALECLERSREIFAHRHGLE